ncbi:MAG: ATP-binding cassette domain-containing protein, partial [Candidatus Omnitrophota bacterium]|nr:ATP-binding cassette domain-containing protein [Candidatus Omnitrophota bacterium]
MVDAKPKIKIKGLNISFGDVRALKDLDLDILQNEILSVIGPANSGKTSFLRSLNRLNDIEDAHKMSGTISLDSKDVYRDMTSEDLRKKVGMIFALPIPLPISIYDNVSYGPRMTGIYNKHELETTVEESLKSAFLWDEVKDRLKSSALKLSGGQQQRL